MHHKRAFGVADIGLNESVGLTSQYLAVNASHITLSSANSCEFQHSAPLQQSTASEVNIARLLNRLKHLYGWSEETIHVQLNPF
jgi:hypothetical protein